MLPSSIPFTVPSAYGGAGSAPAVGGRPYTGAMACVFCGSGSLAVVRPVEHGDGEVVCLGCGRSQGSAVPADERRGRER